MSDDCKRYLEKFTEAAVAAGLNMGKPGKNWAPMRPLVPGAHVSLSLAQHQIQVNLNNERDADRHVYDVLAIDRSAIEAAIGEGLSWEQKPGRKKTAIRATLDQGFADGNWDEQHQWAITKMLAFDREFGSRLRKV